MLHTTIFKRDLNLTVIFKTILWITLLAILIGGVTPVLAQGGGGGDIGATINEVINNIVGIIQQITIGIAILGLALWALGKLARPVFPQLSQLTANYVTEFLIGIVVIFSVSKIVEGIAGAVGGGQ